MTAVLERSGVAAGIAASCVLLTGIGCDGPRGVDVGGIRCERLFEHDFGEVIVEPGEAARTFEYTFRFENPSATEAMDLAIELKSCGCVHSRLHEEHVAPGGHGAVTVGFTPAYASDHRGETLIIKTGQADHARFAFRIAADVHPRIRFASTDPLNLTVRPGRSATALLEVIGERRSGEPGEGITLTTDANWLGIAPTDIAQTSETENLLRLSRTFRLKVDEDRLEERGDQTTWTADVTAAFGPWEASRLVRVIREPFITSRPARLFLRPEGSGVERVVVLSSDREFSILSARSEHDLLEVAVVRLNDMTYRLSVRLPANESRDLPAKTTIVVKTDHPEQGVAMIPVFVFDMREATLDKATGVAGR